MHVEKVHIVKIYTLINHIHIYITKIYTSTDQLYMYVNIYIYIAEILYITKIYTLTDLRSKMIYFVLQQKSKLYYIIFSSPCDK